MGMQEKEWLQAILNGQMDIHHVDWQKIEKEEEFAEIKQVLQNVEKMDFSRRDEDLKKMWQTIEKHRKERTVRRSALWRWAAVAAILLVVGGGWWFLVHEQPLQSDLAQVPLSDRDSSEVILVMAQGQVVKLSDWKEDTTFLQGEVKVYKEGKQSLTYRHEGLVGKAEMNQLIIPRKCEYQVVLSDGTKVYLNAGSRLNYPTYFSENVRRVFLEGEAYFEVARDTSCPFLVETAVQTIQVLGTSFNVCAYPDEQVNYAVLVSGSVAIKDKQTGTHRVLKPGQQLSLEVATGKTVVQEVDVEQKTAWKNGLFVFDDLSLEQIMDKLARWYDVNVFYLHPEVKEYVFKGNMPRYESLDSVLKELEKVSKVKFKVNNGAIMVSL